MGKPVLLNFPHYSFSSKITVLVTLVFDMDKYILSEHMKFHVFSHFKTVA